MKIAFFASSLVSTYSNGAATYYRGIVRALAERGHDITCFEPDVFERQAHRDLADPPWAEVVVYPATDDGALRMVERARGSDLVVKASGVGVGDALLERAVLELASPATTIAFWEVDAPATLDRVRRDPTDPFRALVPRYDLVFTRGGGQPVVDAYQRLGARRCAPIHHALDPSTHHPAPPDLRFQGALGFLGDRLPDRERRFDDLFLGAARRLLDRRFLLGGAGWGDETLPPNVHHLGHVDPSDLDAFHGTPLAALVVSRDALTAYGFWPEARIFAAAGAGACVITDAWEGGEPFLSPGDEVLVARDGEQVAAHLASLTQTRARAIGERALARMRREHTYAHRAVDVEAALGDPPRPRRRRASSPPIRPKQIVIFGRSITSSWGNGHATTYRSLVRALADRGHEVLFLERDVPAYADHRDLTHPAYARTVLYASLGEMRARFESVVRDADLVIVGSHVADGIDVGDWVQATARGATAFYDLDTPATLARLAAGDCAYLRADQVPGYQLYLSFTGGPTLARLERDFGAPRARALHCSVDPDQLVPERRSRRWSIGFMGTYASDRQPALERLLLEPARRCPTHTFSVAGPKYPASVEWPPNVERIDHLAPAEHGAFYGRVAFTLNLTRGDMMQAGWSPSVRLFEAAACGAPVISDLWEGLDHFFEPGEEILVARHTEDILGWLRMPDDERRAIGARARARVVASHSSTHRAIELERYLGELG